MSYDYLVVAPGLKISKASSEQHPRPKLNMTDFDAVKGLTGALEDPHSSNVSTIYSYENADKTWQLIEKFKGEGQAIFTQPQGIIKCAGGERSPLPTRPRCHGALR